MEPGGCLPHLLPACKPGPHRRNGLGRVDFVPIPRTPAAKPTSTQETHRDLSAHTPNMLPNFQRHTREQQTPVGTPIPASYTCERDTQPHTSPVQNVCLEHLQRKPLEPDAHDHIVTGVCTAHELLPDPEPRGLPRGTRQCLARKGPDCCPETVSPGS